MWSLPAAGLSASGAFDAVIGSVALEMELAAPSQQGSVTDVRVGGCLGGLGCYVSRTFQKAYRSGDAIKRCSCMQHSSPL
jgi:hypothetical protein